MLELRPGEDLIVTVAEGSAQFVFLEGVVEGDQSPEISEGDALEVDLDAETQVIRAWPAQPGGPPHFGRFEPGGR